MLKSLMNLHVYGERMELCQHSLNSHPREFEPVKLNSEAHAAKNRRTSDYTSVTVM